MNELFSNLLQQKEKIAVVGLGYVGLPLAVELSKVFDVIGFDINTDKIEMYKKRKDITGEVGDEALKKSTVFFTDNEKELIKAKFYIVSVPTPINSDKTPDLNPIIKATEMIGRNLKKGAVVVYESTVYPGTTEEICIPILERVSNLKFGIDFKVGYSPERINPGDKVNTLTNIVKVVSGSDRIALKIISNVYSRIIKAGIFEAESIKVAEASKVVENTQRDINIAFMNELSMIFEKMNINTKSVLEASGTKWNFMKFEPGLVGGHCIGVDPYYFIYKAEQLGYHSQIISSGRKINDDMGIFIAQKVIKQIIKANKNIQGSRVALCGITFKENCSDVRNTKVVDIIDELKEFGVEVLVFDPIADRQEVRKTYNIELKEITDLVNLDAMIIAVNHNYFTENFNSSNLKQKFKQGNKVFIDVKGAFTKKDFVDAGYMYWNL